MQEFFTAPCLGSKNIKFGIRLCQAYRFCHPQKSIHNISASTKMTARICTCLDLLKRRKTLEFQNSFKLKKKFRIPSDYHVGQLILGREKSYERAQSKALLNKALTSHCILNAWQLGFALFQVTWWFCSAGSSACSLLFLQGLWSCPEAWLTISFS